MAYELITEQISGTECIGDSRFKINNNFFLLDSYTVSLSEQVDELNTRVSNVIPEFPVGTINAGDGIILNQGETSVVGPEVTIAAANSIVGVTQESFVPNSTVSRLATITIPSDSSSIRTYQLAHRFTQPSLTWPVEKPAPNEADEYNTPGVSFETISLNGRPPRLSLYWTTTGSIGRTTLYYFNSSATTANNNPPTRHYSPISPNGAVMGMAFDNDSKDIVEITGEFSWLGNASVRSGAAVNGIPSAQTQQTIRNRYAIISLTNGRAHPDPRLGFQGALSAIPPNNDMNAKSRRFLNSSNADTLGGTAPLYNSGNSIATGDVDGFNGVTRQILRFTISGKRYLCICGDFTNRSATYQVGRGLAMFEETFNSATGRSYDPVPWLVENSSGTGAVYSMLSAGNFLYLGGNFTSIKFGATGTANERYCRGLTRIDMSKVAAGQAVDAIDTAFNDNSTGLVSPTTRSLVNGTGQDGVDGVITRGGQTPSGNFSIYSLAFYNNILYVGGDHRGGRIISGVWERERLSAHYTTGINAGSMTPWKPSLNSTVVSLAMEIPEDAPNEVPTSRPTLYVGGVFTTFSTRGGAVFSRNRLMAFRCDLNPQQPSLWTSWNPNVNNAVRDIGFHGLSASQPIYVSGQFTEIAGKSRGYLAALSKPTTTFGAPVLYEWDPRLNAASVSIGNTGSITRITSNFTTSGVYIGNKFTEIDGRQRRYLTRLAADGENLTVPAISTVEFRIFGQSIPGDSNLGIESNNYFLLSANLPTSPYALQQTTTPLLTGIFVQTSRGSLNRFLVQRTMTRQDNHSGDILLVGASVDYSAFALEEGTSIT